MKNIVVINGTGGSGKDTFVEFCKKYTSVYNFSSIDKVKEIAKEIGWSGTKSDKDRKFLADLKKLTTDYNDMAFNDTIKNIELFNKSDNNVMFIHIREPLEIDKLKKKFNVKSLLIKRTNYEIIKTNSSDANIENYNYDFVIINDTLDNLDNKAKDFIESNL